MRVTRAKDRENKAREIAALATDLGVTYLRRNLSDRRRVKIYLESPDLSASISLDGDSLVESGVLPWCMTLESEKRLSVAFGLEMAAPVNELHRCKCTTFAPDWQSVLWKLRRGFEMAKSGEAFQ